MEKRRKWAISPLVHNIFQSITSAVKLHIHFKMWLFDLFFLNPTTLICRGMDISNYFSESLGLRDNKSQLYLFLTIVFCQKGPFKSVTQLAFYVNLHRVVIGPSATLTGRWRPDIDLHRMLTGKLLSFSISLFWQNRIGSENVARTNTVIFANLMHIVENARLQLPIRVSKYCDWVFSTMTIYGSTSNLPI